VGPFFRAHGANMVVFNGVNTFSNNHDVGIRASMSGNALEGFPIFSAQVAAAKGADRLIPMFSTASYSEAGGLIGTNRIDWNTQAVLEELSRPSFPDNVYTAATGFLSSRSTPVLPTSTVAAIAAAQETRTQRQLAAHQLPGHRNGIASLMRARTAARRMPELNLAPTVSLPAGVASSSALGRACQLGAAGIDAFGQGLTTTLVVGLEGFDTHGDSDLVHRGLLGELFTLASFLLGRAQATGVPTGVILCSDFGRTAAHDGHGGVGTGHWPVSTLMLVQNDLAAARNLMPRNRVIGGTTGEAAAPNAASGTGVLLARKVNTTTLGLDDLGSIITPAHIYRFLRRAAGIETSPVLRNFALNIEGADLTI
jgi:hypothetical protein